MSMLTRFMTQDRGSLHIACLHCTSVPGLAAHRRHAKQPLPLEGPIKALVLPIALIHASGACILPRGERMRADNTGPGVVTHEVDKVGKVVVACRVPDSSCARLLWEEGRQAGSSAVEEYGLVRAAHCNGLWGRVTDSITVTVEDCQLRGVIRRGSAALGLVGSSLGPRVIQP